MREPKPLSTGEIAEYCYVTVITVLKWIREGNLAAYTLPNGHHRIKIKDFYDFLMRYEMPIDEEFFAERVGSANSG